MNKTLKQKEVILKRQLGYSSKYHGRIPKRYLQKILAAHVGDSIMLCPDHWHKVTPLLKRRVQAFKMRGR